MRGVEAWERRPTWIQGSYWDRRELPCSHPFSRQKWGGKGKFILSSCRQQCDSLLLGWDQLPGSQMPRCYLSTARFSFLSWLTPREPPLQQVPLRVLLWWAPKACGFSKAPCSGAQRHTEVSPPASSETRQRVGTASAPYLTSWLDYLAILSNAFSLDHIKQAYVYWEDLLSVCFLADTLNSPSVSWLSPLASEGDGLHPLH